MTGKNEKIPNSEFVRAGKYAIYGDTVTKKRDYYGFMDLTVEELQLFRDWCIRLIRDKSARNPNNGGTIYLSGFNNTTKNGKKYIGGSISLHRGPEPRIPSEESLPNQQQGGVALHVERHDFKRGTTRRTPVPNPAKIKDGEAIKLLNQELGERGW